MSESAAPWTIKAVSIAHREKAKRYAGMADQSLASWMADAIDTYAAYQEGQVILPGKPSKPPPAMPVTDAALALQALAASAQAGLKVSPIAVSRMMAIIREHGYVLGKPRPTKPVFGQTLAELGKPALAHEEAA